MLNCHQPALLLSRVFIIANCALVLLITSTSSTYSQSDCPPTQTARWPKNKTVYYSFSGTNTEQTRQILNGVSAWNTDNQSNGSGVQFRLGPPPSGTSNPATIVFQNGTQPSSSPTASARTNFNTNSNGRITSATVTFYPQGTIGSGGPPIYDPTAPGYDTMVQKIAMHEIGHTMGLGEAPAPLQGIYAIRQMGRVL